MLTLVLAVALATQSESVIYTDETSSVTVKLSHGHQKVLRSEDSILLIVDFKDREPIDAKLVRLTYGVSHMVQEPIIIKTGGKESYLVMMKFKDVCKMGNHEKVRIRIKSKEIDVDTEKIVELMMKNNKTPLKGFIGSAK